MQSLDYIRDPAEIYRQSFSIVREEASLDHLPTNAFDIAVRLVHSCGMVDILDDMEISEAAVVSGKDALKAGCVIYTDVEMVKAGIIQDRLQPDNELICTLNHSDVRGHAETIQNTRSAAAVDFWENISGSIVVIGNAPTALFRLLERIAAGEDKPALVIGIPVGFVGAIESKMALAKNVLGIDFITVHGRRGGSAMASSVLNALAGGLE